MKVKGYRLTAATGIHKGDRDYQQDQVALLAHPRVKGCVMAVLADGMGGRSGGRKASDQVILTARQLFERYSPAMDDPSEMLRQLAAEAHTVIKLTALSTEEEPHSTLAAFIVDSGGSCQWAHAGDSRIYFYRGDRLMKRTLDHSYVQTLVNQGELSAEEANFHPRSNILMGCLGTEKDPPLELAPACQMQPGDTLLVCSDGVWHYFNDIEIGSVLSTLSAREASEFLIAKARSRAKGSGDNLSLAIVKFESPLEPTNKAIDPDGPSAGGDQRKGLWPGDAGAR
jgi:serine/threonine protein phosphatase PrpC